MRSEVITADSIDAAAEQILGELKADTIGGGRSKANVIYFDGWEGLGASAVLRAIAQRLAVASAEAPAGLLFEKIIHVDCSKWESLRALQKAVAQQLELPREVMEMSDRQDENDDYEGLDLASRLPIPQVQRAMHRHIQGLNSRFLVIFHNGSSEEMDMSSFGFPLSEYLDNGVVDLPREISALPWRPGFKIHEALRRSTAKNKTDVFVSASKCGETDPHEFWPVLMRQEAAEVAQQVVSSAQGGTDVDQLAYSFIAHMLKLCCIGHHLIMDYDLATHAGSYWILHQEEEDVYAGLGGDGAGLWKVADALKREMLLDVDYYKYSHQYFPSHLVRYGSSSNWTWPPMGFLPIPAGMVPNADMFQDFGKLSVLKLSRRTFSFSSPPFIHCCNLRFLWLDSCQDDGDQGGRNYSDEAASGTERIAALRRCLGGLLVLHLRNTCCDQILSTQMLDLMTLLRELHVTGSKDCWDMTRLRGRLPSIRKLRVTKSTVNLSSEKDDDDLLSRMAKMELLDFSGNRCIDVGGSEGTAAARRRPLLTMAGNKKLLLETVIIDDGCAGLEHISFRGCGMLNYVLLRGLFEQLQGIDISGTAVKTLDLRPVTTSWRRYEVVALGCAKLCAILWQEDTKQKGYVIAPSRLRIDTTTSFTLDDTRANGTSSSSAQRYGCRAPTEYNWYVSVKDARLLWSLNRLQQRNLVHMEIFSQGHGRTETVGRVPDNLQKRRQEPPVYADVPVTLFTASDGDSDAPIVTRTSPCPLAPYMIAESRYVGIQDQPMRGEVISSSSTTASVVPDTICGYVKILHVHDSKSITCVPGPREGTRWAWSWLDWCRVERCPSLDCVFTCTRVSEDAHIFCDLRTLWCSQLPKVRCIWNLSSPSLAPHFYGRSFELLKFVHVDLCPRLTHVLPLPAALIRTWWFRFRLETLEIVWCGDLRAVFPLDIDADQQQQQEVEFPYLRRIHLHELPKLQGICGRARILAPQLESIRIRGCWSLTRLPDTRRKVKCDCEREWWSNLQWDGIDHQSQYQPIHPRYYKKTHLRSSILR